MLFSARFAAVLAAVQVASAAPIAATTDSSNGLAGILAELGGAATSTVAGVAEATSTAAIVAEATSTAAIVADAAATAAADAAATAVANSAAAADSAATAAADGLVDAAATSSTATSTETGLDSILAQLGSSSDDTGSDASTTDTSSTASSSSSASSEDGLTGIWSLVVSVIKALASQFDVSDKVVDTAVDAVKELSSAA